MEVNMNIKYTPEELRAIAGFQQEVDGFQTSFVEDVPTEEYEFEAFSKIPRLNRDVVITEKIDGTNGQLLINEDGKLVRIGSRNRWLTPRDKQGDNYGFAQWAWDNREALELLGPGRHFGEWWGQGIARRYGVDRKYFSLFNPYRYESFQSPYIEEVGVRVVPIINEGLISEGVLEYAIEKLRMSGSIAAPGFMKPEGIVVYHTAARQAFKVTLEGDDKPKGRS